MTELTNKAQNVAEKRYQSKRERTANDDSAYNNTIQLRITRKMTNKYRTVAIKGNVKKLDGSWK